MKKNIRKGLIFVIVIAIVSVITFAVIFLGFQKNYEKSDTVNFIIKVSHLSISSQNNTTVDIGEAPGRYKLNIDIDINGSAIDVHLFNHSHVLKSWELLKVQYNITYQPTEENQEYADNMYYYKLRVEIYDFPQPIYWPWGFYSNVTLFWELVK